MVTTNTTYKNVTVKFVVNEKGNPPGKLADAELHFNDGALAGLKLIGFGVWERRSGGRFCRAIVSVLASMTARSTTLRSSRTLPGQG